MSCLQFGPADLSSPQTLFVFDPDSYLFFFQRFNLLSYCIFFRCACGGVGWGGGWEFCSLTYSTLICNKEIYFHSNKCC